MWNDMQSLSEAGTGEGGGLAKSFPHPIPYTPSDPITFTIGSPQMRVSACACARNLN